MRNKQIYPWLVVAMLWIVALLNYLDRQMLSTMRPSMMEEIPDLISATNFGRLMAIFLWIYALMSPLSGLIADRVNRKWLIVGSLFTWSTVTFLMGFATTFNQLYILRAIMGTSEAFYIPAALALIADYHQGKTRSFAIGLHTTGIYLGQAFGGFGAVVAGNYSWQLTFQSFGLVGILYCLILILFLKERKSHTLYPQQTNSIKQELIGMYKGVGMLLGNLSFWVILFYFSAPSLPGWATKNWLPTLFSSSLQIDMEQAGPMATITIASASLIGVILGGLLSDRWVQHDLKGRIYTGVIGLMMTIPALFLFGFGQSLLPILSGALLFGVGFGVFDVNTMPILCQFIAPRYRATGYGLLNLAGISAGAFITNLMGRSADAGSMARDFVFLGGLVAVAIVLQLVVLKPTVVDFKGDRR